MYIITDPRDIYIYNSKTVERRVDGSILADGGSVIIGVEGCGIYEMDAIPEDVKPYRYSYTADSGFYLTPDYVEPPAPITAAVIADMQAENGLLKAQIKAQSDRADFMDDCIAEMAAQVYNV